eukprot:38575-Amphidinium_carterae.1
MACEDECPVTPHLNLVSTVLLVLLRWLKLVEHPMQRKGTTSVPQIFVNFSYSCETRANHESVAQPMKGSHVCQGYSAQPAALLLEHCCQPFDVGFCGLGAEKTLSITPINAEPTTIRANEAMPPHLLTKDADACDFNDCV